MVIISFLAAFLASSTSFAAGDVTASKKAHTGLELLISSTSKSGTITLGNDIAGLYLRSIGINACMRTYGRIFQAPSGLSDLMRFCVGYHKSQIDADRTGLVAFQERDVVMIPLSFEPGIRYATNPKIAFFLTGVVRAMLVDSASTDNYVLSKLTDPHFGIEGGVETKINSRDSLTLGMGSFFKEGISFFVGYVKQFN